MYDRDHFIFLFSQGFCDALWRDWQTPLDFEQVGLFSVGPGNLVPSLAESAIHTAQDMLFGQIPDGCLLQTGAGRSDNKDSGLSREQGLRFTPGAALNSFKSFAAVGQHGLVLCGQDIRMNVHRSGDKHMRHIGLHGTRRLTIKRC